MTGLDVDGVLADFVAGFLIRAKAMGLAHRFPATTTDWRVWHSPDEGAFATVWETIKDEHAFWANLPVLPELDAASIASINPGCYVTARPCPTEVTMGWLYHSGFALAPVVTVDVHSTKARELKAMGVTEFVEDKVANFIAINDIGIRCYLLTQPSNEDHVLPEQYRSLRIHTLDRCFD